MLDRISFEAFYRIFFFYCFFDELYALFVCFVSVYSLLLFSCFSQVNFLYDSSSDNWDWISLLFRVLLLFFWGGGRYIHYCFVFTVSRVFWGLFFLYEDWVNIIRVVEWNWLLWWCHISAWYLTRVWTIQDSTRSLKVLTNFFLWSIFKEIGTYLYIKIICDKNYVNFNACMLYRLSLNAYLLYRCCVL